MKTKLKPSLIQAIRANDLAMAKEAIKEREQLPSTLYNGPTHLRYAFKLAAAEGRLEIVKYLISKGVDPRVDSSSALRWATYNNHTEVVNFLKLYEKDDLLHKVIREGLVSGLE